MPKRRKYLKTLRIICCIAACLCVAGAIPLGVWCGVVYALAALLAAALFGAGMYFFKNKSEPEQPTPDFMKSDEENAKLNQNKQNNSDEQ